MTKKEKLLLKENADLKKRNKNLSLRCEEQTKEKILRQQAMATIKEKKTDLSLLRREVYEKSGINKLRREIYALEAKIWG